MNETRTIDVRGLPHHEREALIFPGIEALGDRESLRLILEFNPVPLIHMLKAQGEFEVLHEKEGPEEWILNIKRVAGAGDKKEYFKALLRELKAGEVSDETKERARELLQSVDATTLGIIEQELIREGVSHEEIRRSLCDIHLEVLRDSLVSSRIEVTAPHPVNTFMEEHKVILDTLNDLSSIVERWDGAGSPEGIEEDLARLKDIAHHLVEAENHHQREEEVLFPALESHDIVEPPSIMRMDHVEFRKRKQQLHQLAHNPEDYGPEELRRKVIELGGYLTRELEGHIFKEDNILYQIALQVLAPEEWEEIKKACDKIGYCCFTPEDQS